MPNVSSTTEAIAVRMPKEVAKKARANAEKKGVTVSQYLSKILTLQLMRRR